MDKKNNELYSIDLNVIKSHIDSMSNESLKASAFIQEIDTFSTEALKLTMEEFNEKEKEIGEIVGKFYDSLKEELDSRTNNIIKQMGNEEHVDKIKNAFKLVDRSTVIKTMLEDIKNQVDTPRCKIATVNMREANKWSQKGKNFFIQLLLFPFKYHPLNIFKGYNNLFANTRFFSAWHDRRGANKKSKDAKLEGSNKKLFQIKVVDETRQSTKAILPKLDDIKNMFKLNNSTVSYYLISYIKIKK